MFWWPIRRAPIAANCPGTIQNDILKEYIARGTYIYPPRPAMRIITDLFAWAGAKSCRNGTQSRSAGITSAKLARRPFRKSPLRSRMRLPTSKARSQLVWTIEAFAPRLSFFFNAHSNFLEEIAKYRAARRLYAHLMRERFGAKSDRSCMLRFHTQTAGSTLTAQQPDVNVVRVALQAMAAVLGGTQSLHTNSRDEARGLPTEDAAQLALRTQQVIAYESGITEVSGSVRRQRVHGTTHRQD